MSQELKWGLGAIGLLLAAAGLLIVYLAPRIVDRRNLAQQKQIDPKIAEHLTDEEKQRYRRDGAILDLKLKGLVLAIPGFVLIVYAFR